MMTPEEKGQELIDKFYKEMNYSGHGWARECALICVDEILKEIGYDDGKNYWLAVRSFIQSKGQ